MPAEAGAIGAAFRRRLDGTAAVVVVEEATGADEVALLRPPPGCVMIVTSRSPLPGVGLPGVRRVGLRPLGALDALKLLSERAGWARLAADPGAARAILRCCGQFPLALVIAGAALGGADGKAQVGEFALRLGQETDRLGGDGLAAVLTLADRCLDGRQAQALRALGLLGLPTVQPEVLAAMLCVDRSEAGDRLEELAEARLVDGDGRPYRLHDLVRAFARGLALQVGTEAQRRAVLRRAVAAYADKAELVAGQLGTPLPDGDDAALSGRAGAWAWAEAEEANLVLIVEAAVAASADPPVPLAAIGPSPIAGLTAEEVPGPLLGDAVLPDAELPPVEDAGRPDGRTRAVGGSNDDQLRVEDHPAGHERAPRDRDQFRSRGGAPGEVEDDGRRDLAAAAARLAAATDRLLVVSDGSRELERIRRLGLAAASRAGAARLEAWFAHRLGTLHADEERYEQASALLERAVALADRGGDQDLATLARFDLGIAWCRLHRFEDARPLLEDLLGTGTVDQELGDLVRANLGYVYRHLGHPDEARGLLEESLRSARRRHDARLAAFAERNLDKLVRSADAVPEHPVDAVPATGPMPAVHAPLDAHAWPPRHVPSQPHAAEAAEDPSGTGRVDDRGGTDGGARAEAVGDPGDPGEGVGGPAGVPDTTSPGRLAGTATDRSALAWPAPPAPDARGRERGLPWNRLAALETALDILSREALGASSRKDDPTARATLERLGAAVREVRPAIGRLTEAVEALGPAAPAAQGRWRRLRALCTALGDLRPYVDRLGEAIAATTDQPGAPAALGALAAASESLRVRLDELRSVMRALAPGRPPDDPAVPGVPAPPGAGRHPPEPAQGVPQQGVPQQGVPQMEQAVPNGGAARGRG